MEWLVPAVIATLTSSIALFLVYAYLYKQEHDNCLATWTISWGFYSCRFVFLLLFSLFARHQAFLVGNQLCSLWFGYFLLVGANQFSGRTTSFWWLVGSVANSLWILVATFGGVPFIWLTLPTFSFMALVSIWTGKIFLHFKASSGMGIKIVGYSFIVWGLHKLNYPFLQPIAWFAPWGYLLGTILAFITAVGTILVYFQKTKNELGQSEERNRKILMTAMDGFWRVDMQGRLLEVNDAYCKMSGYDRKELLAMSISDLELKNNDEAIAGHTKDILRKDQDRFESQHRRKDGSHFDVEVSVQYLKTFEEGQCVVFLRDITERKRSYEAQNTFLLKQKLAMDLAKIVHWEYDFVADLFTFNDQFYALYGTTASEQGGYQMAAQEYANRFVPPADAPIVAEAVKQAIHANDPNFLYQGEHRIIRADGQERYISVRFAILKDDHGRTIKSYGANQDITDRKRFEEELKRSNERYQSFVRQTQEAIYRTEFTTPIDISLPVEDQIDAIYENAYMGECNLAMAKMYGLDSVESLVGQRMMTFHGGKDNPVNRSVLRRFIESGYRTVDSETEEVTPNGRRKYFASTDIGVVDNGRLLRIWGTARDVTERKIAEEQLRESREYLRTLVESSLDAIVTTDSDRKIASCNPAFLAMYGYEIEEVVNHPIRILHRSDQSNREWEEKILPQVAQKGFWRGEWEFQRKDGTPVTVDLVISAHRGRQETSYGYVAIHRDITSRKREEAERLRLESLLRQAQKMEALGTLSGGIAHDFNNILSVITGYAEIARDDAQSGTVDPDDINQIIAAADRAKSLVRQILTFSRKVEPERRPLDLNHEVKRAMELLVHTLPKMISIKLRFAPDLDRVSADPGQLSQVILNLASNAFQAMHDGGEITISTKNISIIDKICHTCGATYNGEWVELTISDTGQGIPPDILPRIFDPFFTTKEVGKGTGLGLSMVHGIVLSHGGHVECQSQLGRGTSFTIHLPAAQDTIQAGSSDPSRGTETFRGGSETILLVDDEESLRQLGSRTLKDKGYTVITAKNGEEALEVYRQMGDQLDLVIMDLGMPGMGGHKALKSILEINQAAKIIVASGYSVQGRAKGAIEDGAAGYVGKPFRKAELLETVRAVLERS